jgi:hypothetical protein
MPRKTTAKPTAAKPAPAKPTQEANPSPAQDDQEEQPKEPALPHVSPGEVVRLKFTKLTYEVLAVYSTNAIAIAHSHDPSLAEEWASLRRRGDGQTAYWKVCQLEKVEPKK